MSPTPRVIICPQCGRPSPNRAAQCAQCQYEFQTDFTGSTPSPWPLPQPESIQPVACQPSPAEWPPPLEAYPLEAASAEAASVGEMTFRFPVHHPFAGAFFIIMGIPWIVISVYFLAERSSRPVGWGTLLTLGLCLISGITFAGLGLYMILWRDTLTVDCAAGDYHRRRGLFPFDETAAGPTKNFRGIRVTRHEDPEGPAYWVIDLLWKDAVQRACCLKYATSATEGQAEGRRIAVALGVPLEDLSEAPTPNEVHKSKKGKR